MKQKKLLIFMPSIEMGGVEKNLFIISNFLSSKFDKVKFITSSDNTQNLDKKIQIVKFKIPLLFFNKRIFKIIFSCILLIKEIIKCKNVIIISFQGNLYSILIAKIFGVKIITRLNSSPSGWIKNFLKKKIFSKIYSFSNLIIVNSFEFKREIWSQFKLRSICIYNPLNKKEIIQKAKLSIKKNPFDIKNGIKIMNIGRLVDQKDHLTLLKSINEIKNRIKVQLIIIGQGKCENLLINYIKKKNLNKNIKIIAYKKNPYPYLNCCDLFILTSKYEGLPNVLLEAITLKKFIISSDCPTGPKEILNNGKGGILFKTGSYKELAKKIILFSKNAKSNKTKIDYAYSTLKRYNDKKNLNLYLKKINELN